MKHLLNVKSKATVISIAILVGLFIIFQTYAIISTKNSESQKYTVIKVEKEFEIRFYPKIVMATIDSPPKTYNELGSAGFKKLSNYIFGANINKKKIAMTTPVHMSVNDSLSSMSFVMPINYTKDNLPLPTDSTVKITTTSDEYVAAIKFEGFASEKDIKFYAAKLENALKEKKVFYYGHFRFLGYNPPYQLTGRKNEIIISVNWNEKI